MPTAPNWPLSRVPSTAPGQPAAHTTSAAPGGLGCRICLRLAAFVAPRYAGAGRRWGLKAAAAALASMVLTACAQLPPPPPRKPDASVDVAQTSLARAVAAASPGTGLTGFRLLVSGEDALVSLAALIDRAERTLDLGYYIVEPGASTHALMDRLAAAARRGVRVRLLVDDMNTAGEDAMLWQLSQQPGIAVRLYNPFPTGRMSTVTRVLGSLTDLGRLNRRMHGKMLVADGAIAIAGGRNWGDAYFLQSEQSNFVDLDAVIVGPSVRALSASFERFWNDDLAYPLQAIVKQAPASASAAKAEAQDGSAVPAAAASKPTPDTQTALRVPLDEYAAHALGNKLAPPGSSLIWAPASVHADKPTKTSQPGDAPAADETLADDIDSLMAQARSEVLVITPYYVPGERGMAWAQSLRARGVKLRILTNSLSTTDAPVVHTGYARYRTGLLKAGAELYELRRRLGETEARGTRGVASLGSFGSTEASLHAKALVIDRRIVLIGSMNLNPRSEKLNTELGLVIRSPALAQQIVTLFDDVTRTSAYQLTLVDGDALRWVPPATKPLPMTADASAARLRGLYTVATPSMVAASTTEAAAGASTGAGHGSAAANSAPAKPGSQAGASPPTTPLSSEPETGLMLRWAIRLLGPLAPEEML